LSSARTLWEPSVFRTHAHLCARRRHYSRRGFGTSQLVTRAAERANCHPRVRGQPPVESGGRRLGGPADARPTDRPTPSQQNKSPRSASLIPRRHARRRFMPPNSPRELSVVPFKFIEFYLFLCFYLLHEIRLPRNN